MRAGRALPPSYLRTFLMLTWTNFLAVGFGAAFGAVGRWLLGLWLNHPSSALPWGTLAANAIGGYLIGLLLGVLSLYPDIPRSEEHTSELQSLMRISYAVFCLKKKKSTTTSNT